jgi:NPCBM/NEW2 domain
MLCFRVIFWGVTLFILLIPGFFLVGIIGRVAGFRPGSKVGDVEKVFGWIGCFILGGIMLGICVVAGLIDWAVSSAVENFSTQFALDNQPPTPKAIPPQWDDAKMQKSFLSDMNEFNARVGWGTFGKRGRLGYHIAGRDTILVSGDHYANALSVHPPSWGNSSVSYHLNREYKLLKTWAALSDVEPPFRPESPATFRIYGDRICLWDSGPIQQPGKDSWKACRISVEGVDTLELRVNCPGQNGHVRAVWLEPYVLK